MAAVPLGAFKVLGTREYAHVTRRCEAESCAGPGRCPELDRFAALRHVATNIDRASAVESQRSRSGRSDRAANESAPPAGRGVMPQRGR
jgi:hypothetical protein